MLKYLKSQRSSAYFCPLFFLEICFHNSTLKDQTGNPSGLSVCKSIRNIYENSDFHRPDVKYFALFLFLLFFMFSEHNLISKETSQRGDVHKKRTSYDQLFTGRRTKRNSIGAAFMRYSSRGHAPHESMHPSPICLRSKLT